MEREQRDPVVTVRARRCSVVSLVYTKVCCCTAVYINIVVPVSLGSAVGSYIAAVLWIIQQKRRKGKRLLI